MTDEQVKKAMDDSVAQHASLLERLAGDRTSNVTEEDFRPLLDHIRELAEQNERLRHRLGHNCESNEIRRVFDLWWRKKHPDEPGRAIALLSFQYAAKCFGGDDSQPIAELQAALGKCVKKHRRCDVLIQRLREENLRLRSNGFHCAAGGECPACDRVTELQVENEKLQSMVDEMKGLYAAHQRVEGEEPPDSGWHMYESGV